MEDVTAAVPARLLYRDSPSIESHRPSRRYIYRSASMQSGCVAGRDGWKDSGARYALHR